MTVIARQRWFRAASGSPKLSMESALVPIPQPTSIWVSVHFLIVSHVIPVLPFRFVQLSRSAVRRFSHPMQ